MPLSVPERAVVITQAHRPDQLAAFQESWTNSNWESVFGEPQIVTVAEGDPVHQRWEAHVHVLTAAAADVASVAVFEDVAVPSQRSAGRLSRVLRTLPEETGALWFDASELGPRNRLLHGPAGARMLVRPPLGMHAYLASREWIEAVLPAVSARPGPIEQLIAGTSTALPVFATVPSLARVRTGTGDAA